MLYLAVLVTLAISVIGLFTSVLPKLHDINVYFWANAIHELTIVGIYFPQWIPQLWYGFGLPVFYFYNPLYYTIVEFFQIVGFETVVAINIVSILSIMVGGYSMYLWVREIASKSAGILSGAFFITTPYFLSLIYLRGALIETLALCLIPLLLWAITKFWKSSSMKYFVIATASLSAIVLTHNLTAIIAVFIAFVYIIFLNNQKKSKYNIFLFGIYMGVVSLALTAFYWYPVIENIGLINLPIVLEGRFFYNSNFINIKELLNLLLVGEYGWRTLGIFPLIVLIVGWIAQRDILDEVKRKWLLFILSTTSVLLFLTLPISDFVWSVIPGMEIFQFPSRFLGPTIILLAFAVGLLLDEVVQNVRVRTIVATIAIFVVSVFAIPFVQTISYFDYNLLEEQDLNIFNYMKQVHASTAPIRELDRGIVSFEYLPRRVNIKETYDLLEKTFEPLVVIDDDGEILGDYIRIVLESGNAEIETEIDGWYHSKYSIDTIEYSRIRINQFEFPSWQIRLDDELVETEIIIDEPGQFLDIPAGNHTLELKLVTLPIVFWSRIFSLVVLLLTAIGLIWFKLRENAGRLKKYGKANKNKKS